MNFMHMRTAETEQAAHALGQEGQGLAANWQKARSAIAGSEGGIGQDKLGQAFRTVYTQDSTAVYAAADPVPELLVTDGEAGTKSAGIYRDGDERSEATVRKVTPPQLPL